MRAIARFVAIAGMIAVSAEAGVIEGDITLAHEVGRISDVGPIAAYLSGGPKAVAAARPTAEVRQSDARFDPDFIVVSVGQKVSMPNLDTIFHNVFSYSKPNDFDLGLYPNGETRVVSLNHPGVVNLYCSIHESMSGVILVAPTPYHARADGRGHYQIRDVPAGHYQLTIWNEKLPPTTRDVSVRDDGQVRVDVVIGTLDP